MGHYSLDTGYYSLDIRTTCGDHVTSVSDEIDQIMKVGQNTWFFLRFFPKLISTTGS